MGSILEMREITKRFTGVVALKDVNLVVQAGEIHAICGENGAGKSTLMKVLSGVHPHGTYEGQIFYDGEEVKFDSIRDSEEKGIIIIHQELALVPLMTIAENIFLGNEQATRGVIDSGVTHSRASELLKKVGLKEQPDELITNLGVGKQQLVEIAKALAKKVRLLILDEPTASLNENDSQALLDLLLEFKSHGMTMIMISHKLNEIARVADSVTIIRDGSTVHTMDCRDAPINEDVIIRHMVGREMADRYPHREPNIGEKIFEVKDWVVYHEQHADRKFIKNVNFHVRRGEVLGIAGLMGSGRTELAMSIFGRTYGKNISGSALLNGVEVDISTVEKAIRNKIAYVTEDRKGYGLILENEIQHNVTMANLGGVSSNGVINQGQEFAVASEYKKKINIRCPSVFQLVGNLSGGNQQKVVLSKWLFAGPDVLILDEPTRGIDVGAKYEIYCLIEQLAKEGKCIIMISSEMPELLGMTDRLYVMNEGALIAEMKTSDASQEKIMRAIVTAGKG